MDELLELLQKATRQAGHCPTGGYVAPKECGFGVEFHGQVYHVRIEIGHQPDPSQIEDKPR